MTEKLYMESIDACYLQSFDAKVIAIEDQKIILDRTLFYPIGGGQNWDVGTISSDTGEIKVTEVRGRDDVEHFVEEDHGLSVGDAITGQIDWDRRHAHMRMHTAQHLVSGIVYEMFSGVRTVGNQIHQERSRIDFNPVRFEPEMIDRVFDKTNEIIKSNLPVSVSIMTRDEVNKIMPPERTNMDLLPKSVSQLRVVQIGDGVDLCPCAGTHVKELGEIGDIEFIGKKSKGKGTQRVSYKLANP